MTKQYKLIFDVSEAKTFCSDDTAVLLRNSSKESKWIYTSSTSGGRGV